MGEIDFMTLAHSIKSFSDTIIGPLVLVLIPAAVTAYFKLSKGISKVKERLKKGWSDKLQDWEANFSRQVIREIGFFIDGIHSNPYCRADQILYLDIENGIVGPSNLHSMFISVQAESTGVSRCLPKVNIVQRVPYTEMAHWCNDLEKEQVLKLADINESSPFFGMKVHSDAKSAIIVPVYTKENWLAGMVVFNYFDEMFNYQEDTKRCEQLIQSVKAFIEGQFLHKEMARQNWINSHS